MKSKEDLAVRCALGGGVFGLLLGVASAVSTWHDEGGGFLTVMDGLLQIVQWCFVFALGGGVLAYGARWVIERKLGLAPEPGEAPDVILQKVSYLRGLQTETQKACAEITTHVADAEKHLDAAEKEFAEGAFAPFWDRVECAANELAAYKNEVEHLQRNVSVHNQEAGELLRLGGPSVMPLLVHESQLPDARPSAARFMGIVRKAQTNFQFAMIFEQRKTNQLLHTGFGTLGAAIHTLGESINESLNKLARSLDANTDRMLSYQDPLRHMLSKTAAIGKKPAEDAPRLPRLE
ncbi:MAG TPA: hypothetical protein VHC95_01465 [Opitutales bacterium]|nr:hypothetical protein [Opitutales bacterium]